MTETDRPSDAGQWSHVPPREGTLPFDPQKLPPLPPKWSAPTADALVEDVWKDFENVRIRCTMTRCNEDLHCFRLKATTALAPGSCRGCNKLLVSLDRTAARNLDDVDATFAALQRECVRHYFWHVPFGQHALDYARRAGWRKLEPRIERHIRQAIGAAEPFHDGWQTPTSRLKADAIHMAMHAVAACCRTCANYWHGIPKGRPLEDREVSYLTDLARRYLRARLPDLPDDSTKIPAHRRPPNNVHPIQSSQPETPASNAQDSAHPQAS
jgi:hypothetical protein